LSYAEKFDSALNFFLPKEKVEEIREKMEKLIEVNRRLQYPLFSLFMGPSSAASCSAAGAPPEGCRGQRRGKRDLSTCKFSSQDFPYRNNYTCEEIPARIYLQAASRRPSGAFLFCNAASAEHQDTEAYMTAGGGGATPALVQHAPRRSTYYG
jgi:hypothetical protein